MVEVVLDEPGNEGVMNQRPAEGQVPTPCPLFFSVKVIRGAKKVMR